MWIYRNTVLESGLYSGDIGESAALVGFKSYIKKAPHLRGLGKWVRLKDHYRIAVFNSFIMVFLNENQQILTVLKEKCMMLL